MARESTVTLFSAPPIEHGIDVVRESAPLPALHEEVRAAVLRPARVVMIAALWSFLSVADRRYACRLNALRDEVIHRGLGAPIAERQVVLFGAALVAVPFDEQARVRVGAEPPGIGVQDLGVAGPDHILVEIEMDVDEVTNTDEFGGRRARVACT